MTHKNLIAKKLADDELITLNTVKLAANLIDEYHEALQRIAQSTSHQEAISIALIALM